MNWATFWATFSQTHLVTLLKRNKISTSMLDSWDKGSVTKGRFYK
jgi:hypothetical protein